MRVRVFSSCCIRFQITVVMFVLTLAMAAERLLAATGDPGTIGVGLAQLYSDSQPNKRGPLVVLQVNAGSPGAKAGMQKGDLVVAINGSPTAGRELEEILRKDIRGPVGGTLQLTLARLDGTQSDLTLTRVAYAPHTNPASDPCSYVIPGSWGVDPRVPFPLNWAPTIPYQGWEDLGFTTSFDDASSPEYHSYVFFWWLEGTKEFNAQQLQADMLVYFRGLAQDRGKDYGFTPDISQVSARYDADGPGLKTFGGSAAKSFSGEVSIYDTHGKVITLHSEVVASVCSKTNHTALFFGMSLEPRDGAIWPQLDAVRDSFRCNRLAGGLKERLKSPGRGPE